jgi:hypothetical protein
MYCAWYGLLLPAMVRDRPTPKRKSVWLCALKVTNTWLSPPNQQPASRGFPLSITTTIPTTTHATTQTVKKTAAWRILPPDRF